MPYPVKGQADYLDLGTWNATCSLCGRKRKANQLLKHWTGFWRCKEHWEVRQPQDFVKGIQDVQTVPWSQPQTDIELAVCSFNGQAAIAGWGVAGCILAGNFIVDPASI